MKFRNKTNHFSIIFFLFFLIFSTEAYSKSSLYHYLQNLPKHSNSSKISSSLKSLTYKIGRRYVWGATGPNTFDCSGLTTYAFKKKGIKIPRRAIEQSKVGKKISRKNLKPGDLVFFDTSKRRKGSKFVNHVGIYLGHNKFLHASSAKKKVVITSLNKSFYKNRFKWGRRI